MKKLTTFFIGLATLLSAAVALADTAAPICLTLNHPNKWEAGLVLMISSNSDGSLSASLESYPMFLGAVTSSTGPATMMAVVSAVKKTDLASGGSSYVVASDVQGQSLNVNILPPDANGTVLASVDLQLIGGLSISVKDATPTQFRGDYKCQ